MTLLKNKDESRRVARHKNVGAKAKDCYRNAFRVIQYVPGYQNAVYIEGFAVTDNGVPVEHGWIERNGQIIDPTRSDSEMMYFPGLRFEGAAGVARAMKEIPKEKGFDDLPLFYRFGWGGSESEDFNRARREANDYSRNQVRRRK